MRAAIHIQKLLTQGERDLENAKKILVEVGAYEIVCFLCQQACEKMLKALYMKTYKRYIPTHSLIELAKALHVPSEIYNKLAILTPDYIVTRYPDAATTAPYEIFTLHIASYKIKLAEEIIYWIKEKVKDNTEINRIKVK